MSSPAVKDILALRAGWLMLSEQSLEVISSLEKKYSLALLGQETSRALMNELRGSSLSMQVDTLGVCESDVDHYGLNSLTADYQLARSAEAVAVLDVPTVAEIGIQYGKIRQFLTKALNRTNSSTIALLDATALPKSALSFIIGILLRTRSVRGIDIIYRRARYSYKGVSLENIYNDKLRSREINDIEFDLAPVPYVEGKYNAARKRHLILLAGMDYHRAFWKINELEPSVIDLIVDPDAMMPPLKPDGLLERLRKELDYDLTSVVCARRTDFLDVYKSLKQLMRQGRAETAGLQPLLVVAGWKPYLIAATLYSLMESEAPLFVTIPDRVVPLEVRWESDFLLYRLRDRTAIVS